MRVDLCCSDIYVPEEFLHIACASTPFSNKCVAKLWRSEWKLAGFCIPAAVRALANIFCTLRSFIFPPRLLSNRYSIGSRPAMSERKSPIIFSESTERRSFTPFDWRIERMSSSRSMSPTQILMTSLTRRPAA